MPVLSINDFLRAMHVVVPTSRKGSDVFIRPQPSLSWDSVGGLVDVKTQLQQVFRHTIITIIRRSTLQN